MASAQFELDPGTGTYGSTPQAVSVAGATVNCRLLSVSGVNPSLISWSIVGTNNSGVSTPSITTSGNPDGQIASFTVPAGANQAYIVRCEVNGGPDVTGEDTTAYQGKFYVLNANTRQPIAVGETTEGQSTHGIVDVLDEVNNQTGGSNDAAFLQGITLEAATVGAPNNGDVIYYNSGSGEYVAGAPSAITLTLAQVLADGNQTGGKPIRVDSGDRIELEDDQRYIKSSATSGIEYHAGILASQEHRFFFNNSEKVVLEATQATFQVNGYTLRWYDSMSSPFDVLTALNGDVTLSAKAGSDVNITGSTITLTGTVVHTGGIDLPNNEKVRFERNAGGGVYVEGITVNTSDDVLVGDSTNAQHVFLNAGTGVVIAAVAGTTKAVVRSTEVELKNGVAFQWEAAAVSPTITQADETTTADADDLLIKAQSNTNVTSGDGGHVVLDGGASTAGTPGEVRVKSNSLTIVRFYDAAVSGFPAFAFNGDDAASGGAAFIGMDAPTSDVATPLMVIQACGAAAATNRNGGRLELRPGLPQGAGSAGYIAFTDGSAAHTMRVHADRAEMQSSHAVDFAGEVDIQRQTTTVIASDSAALILGSAGNNIALGADASNWQSMTLGTFVANATAEPTGNPASGAFLWSTSGALKSRSSDGLIDEISPRLQSGTPGGSNIIRRRWVEGQLGIGASGTTVLTYPVPDETTETLIITVNMFDATANESNSYVEAATVKRHAAGSATMVGTTTVIHSAEDDATWDATITVSGNDVVVQLDGDGSNAVDYQVIAEIHEHTP